MIVDIALAEFLRDGAAISEITRAASQDAAQITAHPQEYFGDEEVKAALDYSRSIARLFILLCVSSSAMFICYGAILLMASGGEPRKMDQSRAVFLNVAIGLVVSISSYLIISSAISVALNVIGVPETVRFWDATVFEDDFGFYQLLDTDNEYALEGEVIMMDGATPVICEAGLLLIARESGWMYGVVLPGTGGTDDIKGCTKN